MKESDLSDDNASSDAQGSAYQEALDEANDP